MDKIIYAIGDIHGRYDLLHALRSSIFEHHNLLHREKEAELIYLGDYIDRGPDSRAVIDELMQETDGFEVTCLLGNHEAMLLECLCTDNRQAWHTWLSNGGDATLASFGMTMRFGGYDPKALQACIGAERIAWLQSLPLWKVEQPYLFVHAGIAPGVPIEEQNAKDLLWIRSRFLNSTENHGCIVVHGHTPGEEPVVKANRICLDTGAVTTGRLTAAVLHGDNPPIFLRATE